MSNSLELLLKSLVSIVIAMIGGIVNALRKEEVITQTFIITNMIISGFVGLMVALLLNDVSWGLFKKDAIKWFLAGMSGYSSGAILDIFEKRVKNYMRVIK